MMRLLGLLCLLIVGNMYAASCKTHTATYISCVAENKINDKSTKKCDKHRLDFLRCNKKDICSSIAATDCTPLEKTYVSCVVKNEVQGKSTKNCTSKKSALVMCHENKELIKICRERKNKNLFSKYYEHTHGGEKSSNAEKSAKTRQKEIKRNLERQRVSAQAQREAAQREATRGQAAKKEATKRKVAKKQINNEVKIKQEDQIQKEIIKTEDAEARALAKMIEEADKREAAKKRANDTREAK